MRLSQIDSVFPVGWTCKNLASQPKKKTKRQEKTKAKSHLRQCFQEKLCQKYLKNTRFVRNVVSFSYEMSENLANFQREKQNQFATA